MEQQRRAGRGVRAMGLVVEVQRRGQGLMLSDRKHRSERGGVVEMRMEQRQAGSEVRTSRDVGLARV